MRLIELFENWRNRKPVTETSVYMVVPAQAPPVIKPGDWVMFKIHDVGSRAKKKSQETGEPHQILQVWRMPLDQLEPKGRGDNWAEYIGTEPMKATVAYVTVLKQYPRGAMWTTETPERKLNDAEGNMHDDAWRADWNSWGTHGMGQGGLNKGFSSSPDMPGILLPGEAEPEEDRLEVVKRK